MKILTANLIVVMLLGAALAPTACAETTTEVVLIGRGDLLARNAPAPAPRHVTRIERFVEPVPGALNDPALAALDDPQVALLAAIPNTQPVFDHWVAPARQSDPQRAARESIISPETAPFAAEEIPPSMFAAQVRRDVLTPAIVVVILILMPIVTGRRWIFAAINRLVLGLVVAVHQRGAAIVSPSRRRRRRSSSRSRSQNAHWYFRASRTSSRSRGRRRWSSSGRPRDYVVTDVVYAAAPAQTAPRYLLTNSVN